MAFSTGYDMSEDFKFDDGLGMLYTGIAIVWSIALCCGCIFLTLNRELPFLRIRGVPLTISAVAILHVYWVLCLVAYGLNGYFPCATEFWIMNIYLPLGIALFHLSNAKLLLVAVLQRRYTSTDTLPGEKETLIRANHSWKSRAQNFAKYSTYKKAKWAILVGMLVQLTCALFIFLISRKFHSGFGLVGKAVPESATSRGQCRRGWEWILSIAWQFLWSWVFAPYLLWKVRSIQDTHGWRLQTIVCCLAGLPATPMWLLALYLPQMSIVNRYFIPPMWFVPSILLIEAFMIFLPCWQIIQHRRLKKETLDIIAQWEKDKKDGSASTETSSFPQSPQRMSKKSSIRSSTSSRKAHPHMYTMAALEKALQTNSTPLLLFAALKDFSGENISFLNHVRDWNKDWIQRQSSMLRAGPVATTTNLRYKQFVRAIEIYSSFVSLRYSNFPINISHSHLKELEHIFHESALVVHSDNQDQTNEVTPFADFNSEVHLIDGSRGKDEISTVSTAVDTASNSTESDFTSNSKQSTVINIYKLKDLGDKLPQSLPIPPDFGPGVFDNAAESIKYMVLTNTWPKFVDAGYAANMERTTIERFQERMSGYGIGRSRIYSF